MAGTSAYLALSLKLKLEIVHLARLTHKQTPSKKKKEIGILHLKRFVLPTSLNFERTR
jgi:hypothetical protein